MKRRIIMGILMLGVLCFAACGRENSNDFAGQEEEQVEEQVEEQDVQEEVTDEISFEDDMVIVWKDVEVETIVRTQLQKQEGDITYKDVKLITSLDFNGQNVEYIDDLKYFTNLEYLNISSTAVADVSILSGLDNLKEFVSLNKYVDDYSALNDIDNIRTVHVGNLETFDFSWLKDIDSLEELGVVGVIEDTDELVEVMNRNPNMKCLHLKDNQLDDFSFLKKCKYKETYEKLSLSSYTIKGKNAELDVNDLTGYKNLKELFMFNTNIKNAMSLNQFDTVYEMRISGSQIDKETVSAILEMENLSILYLSDCPIEDETSLRNSDKGLELYIS